MSSNSQRMISLFESLNNLNIGDIWKWEFIKSPIGAMSRLEIIVLVHGVHRIPEIVSCTFLTQPPGMARTILRHLRTIIQKEITIAETAVPFSPITVIIARPSLRRTYKVYSLRQADLSQSGGHCSVWFLVSIEMIMAIATHPSIFFQRIPRLQINFGL